MGKASANYGSSADIEAVGVGNRKWSLLAFVEGQESLSWGITCAIEELNGPDSLDVLFRISWGDGGVQHQIELTPNNGFTVNVHGSSIKVEASVDSAVGDSALVSASLSEQDSGRLAPIYSVLTGGIAAAGGSEVVELPPFTRRVMVIPTSFDPLGFQWRVDANFWGMTFLPNEKMDWQPVVWNAITIFNDDPAQVWNFAVFCELSI